jgi:hypothetical protein
MFRMTDCTGPIFDHVELVKVVTHKAFSVGLFAVFLSAFTVVAGLAFLIDGIKGDPSMEAIVDHFGELLGG